MKKCLSCKITFPSSDNTCNACGFTYEMIDGFPAYAASHSFEGSGFKSDYFSELANLEAQNFWFRARNRLIVWAINKYKPNFVSFLEIGCGTGFVLSAVAKQFPNRNIQGSEFFVEGLKFAANRLPNIKLMQMDAREIPFINEFDCLGAFDVIEHINEDTKVLQQIHQALKPQGIIILTVPQHPWLWSSVDDYACHVRRYTAQELHSKLENNSFKILRSTSFVSTLLPVMIISRLISKFFSSNVTPKNVGLEISPWLNVSDPRTPYYHLIV